MQIADQADAALVAAMAREAIEDGSLIEGAALTEREVRALWTLQQQGVGRVES